MTNESIANESIANESIANKPPTDPPIADRPTAKRPQSGEAAIQSIKSALRQRFGEEFAVEPDLSGLDALARIASYRSHRRYLPRPIEPDLLRLLCACALSAPSKSDLQQCDIVTIGDAAIRKSIVATIPDMPWIEDAPAFLMFVANGERLPFIAKQHRKPFPNDHLDQFFNAAVDAAIVLATFIQAAAAIGLGCCPISAVRDHPRTVSKLLRLPKRAVAVAGLCVGWPVQAGDITPRLSLATTTIDTSYGERDLAAEIDAYDRRRAKARPYRRQRDPGRWGEAPFYGWSEDKSRQYAEPTRTDFGSFVRENGFCLD